MLPPLPPSPPLGGPAAMNFSRRKEIQPCPPEPAVSERVHLSVKIVRP